MTEADLVEAIFRREGTKYGDQTTHPPIDQPTGAGGITLPTLSEYLGRDATVEELKALTKATAAPVVLWNLQRFQQKHRFNFIAYEPLRNQMIDFAYNSGPALAVRWLQRVLRVPRTGVLDAPTLDALAVVDPWLVHHALIAARLQMVDMWSDGDSDAKKFEEGVESRALSFSLLEVP